MSGPHEGRPPHPTYGPPLSGAPWTVEGVTFRPYRTPGRASQYVRVSDDFRIEVAQRSPFHLTYVASVDGQRLRPYFRTQRTAAQAAIIALKKKDTHDQG